MNQMVRICCILTCLICLNTAPANDWVRKADMPTARGQISAGVVDSVIYVIGGTPLQATVEAYDPVRDTWEAKADMPTPRVTDTSTSVVDGLIYTIGGSKGGGQIIPTVEVYAPATDTWEARADMPTPRANFPTCELNGRIYAFGGEHSANLAAPTGIVEEYDPVNNTWAKKADMPDIREGHAAVAVDDSIYIIGGEDTGILSGPAISTVQAYDPDTDTWTRKADMPTARAGLTAVVVNGNIYAIGGIVNGVLLPTVEIYDPMRDSWRAGVDLPTTRTLHSCAAVDGRIYVIGGWDTVAWAAGRPTSLVQELDTGLRAVSSDSKLALTWGHLRKP